MHTALLPKLAAESPHITRDAKFASPCSSPSALREVFTCSDFSKVCAFLSNAGERRRGNDLGNALEMAASPGHFPRKSSPLSVRSSDTCELQVGERDLARFRSTVPDSQPCITKSFDELPAKKFSAANDEISENVLGLGFAFAPKQPSRPGQYSERPFPRGLMANESTSKSKPNVEHRTLLNGPTERSLNAAPRTRAVPFDLHELSLVANRGGPDPIEQPRLDIALSSPRGDRPSGDRKTQSPDIPSRQPSAVPQLQPSTEDLSLSSDPPSQIQESQEVRPLTLPAVSDHNCSPSNKQTEAAPPIRDASMTIGGDPLSSNSIAPMNKPKSAAAALTDDIERLGSLLPSRSKRSDAVIQSSYFQAGKPATPKVHGASRREAPSSACGDLEGPIHRSPRERWKSTMTRPVPVHDLADHDRTARHRPPSRTSNISRKRSAIRKPRGKDDADRKRMAMHQVAQYWNECMQIADEEQDYASWKIDALQDNLHRYQLKLSDARSQLEDKKGELRRMETCYQQLQEKTGRSAEHSKNLERDIESLQAELSGTRERATEFEERTRRYRGKINETITEQQNLWKRSRDFHTMTMTDLQQDRENRMSESKRLEEALEVSRHKREEMSKCLEELRGHMDHERKAKDKVISDLQCKLMEQENRIRRDNDLATLVNRQLKAQESTQETVSMLESKVESLLVQSRKTRHELDEDVASIADTYRKIETLVERLEDWEENTLLAAINDTTQKMTDQFEAHVKCALSEASENHQIAMTTVHELLSGLQSNLKTISQEMDRQDGEFKTSRASGVEAREKIRERIDKSQRDLNAMRNDMKQFRDELLLEFRSGKDFAAARMDLMKQLDQRDKTFHSLEQQLRSLTEETSRKLTALRERALHTEQSGQLEIRNVVSSLERSLEQGFKAAQVGSERNLRQTQSAMAAFGGQLRAVSDQLEARFCPPDHSTATSTSHTAGDEIVQQMQLRIRDLEGQLTATAQLRARWQQDIKTIGTLTLQLRTIEDRLPQAENIGATVERIAEVNQLLHSTAKYLAGERIWVQHISRKVDSQGILTTRTRGLDQRGQPAVYPGAVTKSPENISLIHRMKPSLVLGDVPCFEMPIAREAKNGASGATMHPPSSAPSIEQEQIRRREAGKPRSILKLSSSQESGDLQGQVAASMPCSVDENNLDEVASGSTSTEKTLRDIRRGLLSGDGASSFWSLPTIATFEKDHSMTGKRQTAMAGRKHSLGRENEMAELGKRVRIAPGRSASGIASSRN